MSCAVTMRKNLMVDFDSLLEDKEKWIRMEQEDFVKLQIKPITSTQ